MPKIYLLRHGHCTLSGKYVGSTDAPLTEKGWAQIYQLAEGKPFSGVSKIYCSPLLRCRQSLEALSLGGVKVMHEERLREIDFGLWEGLCFDEVYKGYRAEFDAWCAFPESFVFPQGEAVHAFYERVAFMGETLKGETEDILVIAHGGVIRNLLCYLLGFGPEHAMKFDIGLGRYAIIDIYDNSSVLIALNHGPKGV